MSFEKRIQTTSEAILSLRENEILYKWISVDKEESDLCRASHMQLMVLYYDNEYNPEVRRIFSKQCQDEYKDDTLKYSPGWLRLLSGNRKGRLVSPDELKDDDKVCGTGTHKKLRAAEDSDCLDASREADRETVAHLRGVTPLQVDKMPVSDHIKIPPLWLTRGEDAYGSVHIRAASSAIKEIQQYLVYDPAKRPAENAKELAPYLTKPMKALGKPKTAWPWHLFVGSGVVVCEKEDLNVWQCCTSLDTDSAVVSISEWRDW